MQFKNDVRKENIDSQLHHMLILIQIPNVALTKYFQTGLYYTGTNRRIVDVLTYK